MLADMQGADYDDERWYELLNRITTDEMLSLHNNGGFQTVGIDSIGKSQTWDSDGPAGWVNFVVGFSQRFEGTCTYAAEIVFACSWNTDLLYRFGQTVGDEALTGYTYEEQVTNEDGTTETVIRHIPYTGWYAPAINIHRSAFGGRNWEYYGEDGYLSGKLAAEQIKGLREKGVIPYLKHFAVNEQETTRNAGGLVTWVTEQAMREIYLRPFEIAVNEGKTNRMMSSFNRIGTRRAGGDYRLLTEVLRNEWGFRGAVITDYYQSGIVNDIDEGVRCGNTQVLHPDLSESVFDDLKSNTAQKYIHKSAKDILYSYVETKYYAMTNSGLTHEDVIGTGSEVFAWWIPVLIGIDVICAGLMGVWIFFAVRTVRKKTSASSDFTTSAGRNA